MRQRSSVEAERPARWRHVRAIVLLPGTVTVLVPGLILWAGEGPDVGWGLDDAAAVVLIGAGAGLVAAGLAIWIWTVTLFARLGRGTLAPWDPTRELVVAGPYGHVRNPMISGVLAVLMGEALALGSPGIVAWGAAFVVINHLYFLAVEEPGLERRFGEAYREYRRHVPRWIPRLRRWAPR